MNCLECQKEFKTTRKSKRFCSETCKNIYHGKERYRRIQLTDDLLVQLEALAMAHDVSIHEMACLVFHQALNPGQRPLDDSEIYGVPT